MGREKDVEIDEKNFSEKDREQKMRGNESNIYKDKETRFRKIPSSFTLDRLQLVPNNSGINPTISGPESQLIDSDPDIVGIR